MPAKKKKLFVLDTNVILHDSSCIYQFQENDIIIPITVLEELDQFKKGNETLNYHARDFLRSLDTLSGDKLFTGGVTIGPGLGKIIIKLEQKVHDDLVFNFSTNHPDHRILNTAYHVAMKNSRTQVILVSKDVNLRMKAKSIGLMAQDYITDHVKDVSALYRGHRILENVREDLIDQMYKAPYEINVSELQLEQPLSANESVIMRDGKKSALGIFQGCSILKI
ncbi:MAG TPA: PIN domain-containing protein [bacterium]